MTPREYIETAMKLAAQIATGRLGYEALESHLRENLDALLEAAYDRGLEDRDE
jgi:hypothetical protein